MAKFYELTPSERLQALQAKGGISAEQARLYAQDWSLSPSVAGHLIENQVSQWALPLGVLTALPVNGRSHLVPMVTEEPSVIAAANNGARIARDNGGITVTVAPRLMIGEIVFDHLDQLAEAQALVTARQTEIFAQAQAAKPSIVERGGGLQQIDASVLADRFLKLSLFIDTRDAMGANIINTIAEAVGQLVGTWLNQEPLVSVLSNATPNVVKATVNLDPKTLATKDHSGLVIADKIVAASDLALVDPDRAATHNKGIMNGITAVALATGNDTRALETGVHTYASHSGHYLPVSTWQWQGDRLVGTFSAPLIVGSVGGAIGALPMAQQNLAVMGVQSAQDLQQVMAAVGLVQNLAALRALVGPGIQAGHMALQANALAIAAGAVGPEIEAVVQQLHHQSKDLATAKAILQQIKQRD
ncbi:hydroxymethylglutaryl-CoA reductase, degradative [Lacticaseibacillus brantae]|uniref:3-hydroxy-3-methylglutaryl coenzyme A reductase n=1 Tax=Lacticaseibacillus brantae DSM 23927 TaxID=1423727 RepID=A0A0R2AYL9_9LACO|nr:hydroxymethylglutaryl-CoA reductase, degradative [Lacticaseibacillus brantae]KRM72433.1 hydroxymethylglutaryl-CoA reductase, degradative [Lacticaseibacillus brantae DSM 23927]